jgi:protein-S-isoprenylcysteine O-methyltransferase Ste14
MSVQALLLAYGGLLVGFLSLRRGPPPRLLAASSRGALATWSFVAQLDLLAQAARARTASLDLFPGLAVGAAVFAWLALGPRRWKWPGFAWVVIAGSAIGSLRPGSAEWVASALLSTLAGAWSGVAIERDRHRASRSLAHWVSFLGAFALVLPAALANGAGGKSTGEGSLVRASLALLLLVGGSTLALWATAAFHDAGGTPEPVDPPARLCTRGPYRHVRHPLQLAEMALVWAGVLLQWSPLGALYAIGFCAFLKGPIRWHEERVLERRFGAAAGEFRRSVPAYLPRLRLRRPEALPLSSFDGSVPPASG